ncbi:hypothetical protein STCU_05093 [Strigomonas culicis]|uniref:Transmembrane protein n=1 Tax=Strigomonas culicis TaxID=28005 RepID=S9UCE4_9TRYP|nr:hypothetical protein STCU_05093 [Strigomonas culicis]|eukprot:EPY28487.1 hypothetical protein STCU_05093 [Strigomonas culicis]
MPRHVHPPSFSLPQKKEDTSSVDQYTTLRPATLSAMSRLDIEQQLRDLEKRGGELSAFDVVKISFLRREYYDCVQQASVVIAATAAVLALLLLILSVFPAKVAKLYAKNITAARVTFFSSLTPFLTSLFAVSWVILVSANGVFSLMKHAALLHEEHRKVDPSIGSPKELALVELLRSAPFLTFAIETMGIIFEWTAYALCRTDVEVPLMGALLVFFPSLYQSLTLDSTEPDRLPLWITHSVLFTTLFVLFCLSRTFVMVNYKLIKEEYNKHLTNSLYKDRKEMKELKSRPDVMQRRSAAVKKRS